jgi:hypothetical protein
MLASSLALLRVTEFCQNVGRLQEPSVKFAMMAHVRESFHQWQRDWTLGERKSMLGLANRPRTIILTFGHL